MKACSVCSADTPTCNNCHDRHRDHVPTSWSLAHALRFEDLGATVSATLPLPPGASPEALRVSGGADYLDVKLQGADAPLLSVLQLYATIDPDRTEVIADGAASEVSVTLHKLDPGAFWPGLEAVEAPPEEEQALSSLLPRARLLAVSQGLCSSGGALRRCLLSQPCKGIHAGLQHE